MIVKAVKLYENGFMTQPFAFGGEDGPADFDPSVRFRSSLQNFVIETDDEVILVDTGMPDGVPDAVPDDKTPLFMGNRIEDYFDALKSAGYTPDRVSKILITHKHDDHTGMISAFPNAKVYISPEDADALDLKGENIIRLSYGDGPYHGFPRSQKVAEGIRIIEAKGHTKGNSIIIAEDRDLFFMFHGDITYTDEALYADKLSVVYEDLSAARETLDRVRAFIRANPTVYLSTHTPLGYENLEDLRVIDLDNPPETVPVGEIVYRSATGKYICGVCGFVYDPEKGDPTQGVPPGTPFEELPDDWHCPRCKREKTNFNRA
ncbi:MAG: rubredoxin [Candidatus Methanomethylophilaceae archaeon]|nr:rubredoxin [Candidatus Methanomethylophilaceae archaeon]